MPARQVSRSRWLLAVLALALPQASQAALEQISTLPLVAVASAYQVREQVLDNGGVVREYTDAAQRVFALQWRGPVLPDLRLWLGSYHEVFVRQAEAVRASGLRGGPLAFSSQGLVLRSVGRMRDFQGHAYLPARVPVGVDIRDLLR